MNHIFRLPALFAFSFLLLCASVFGQDGSKSKDAAEKKEKKEVVSATIKGKFVQSDDKKFKVDFSKLNPFLTEQIKLPEPPIPSTWEKMSMEERQQWVKDFESSDKGKAFLEDRKQRIENADRIPIQVEENGNFVLFDVPHGTYGLRGLLEQKIENKTFLLEVFGKIDVAETVEEVLLDPMQVAVTRLLQTGDSLPDFKVPTFDEKTTIHNGLFDREEIKGKHVLINFWSMKSPPSQEFGKQIQTACKEVGAKHGIHLLSVCVDSDPKKALEYVKTMRIRGWHGFTESWDHEIIGEFGVRVIPSLYLANPDQKILLTNFDFQRARQLGDSDLTLTKIVLDAINGKPLAATEKAESD